MKTIGATAFKQTCLAVLDRLGPDGIVITKHGKPVARLVPVGGLGRAHRQPGGKIRVHGDLLTTGLPWDAES